VESGVGVLLRSLQGIIIVLVFVSFGKVMKNMGVGKEWRDGVLVYILRMDGVVSRSLFRLQTWESGIRISVLPISNQLGYHPSDI